MLRTQLLLAAMAATSFAVVGVGCGPADDKQDPTPQAGVQPPAPSPSAAACTGDDVTMAVSKLYLGDTKRDGLPDVNNGWKLYGFDLDGQVSTKESTGLCKPRASATPSSIYPDGLEGIDNSFGKNILPILLGLSADLSASANESLFEGDFTIMLNMAGIGTEANCKGVVAKLFGGANYGDAHMAAPKWDGTDMWPLLPELLNGGNKEDPKIKFNESYVVDNTWVSGTKGTVALSLSISGISVSLEIKSAYITIDLDPTRKKGTNGTIAGVLDTQQLVDQISGVAASIDKSFCDPTSPTLKNILAQLEQASDIMKDGTQDPAQECNGISIGIGFDATAVQLGDVADPAAPAPDPCEEATP